jgi:hypothetical protein
MKTRVNVTRPENFNNSTPHPDYPFLGVNKSNPDYGYIMLTSECPVVVNGWARVERRVGRITNRVSDLINLIKVTGLKEGDDFSAKVTPVMLRIKESTTPFYEGQEPKINPTTGEIKLHKGQEIYRSTFVEQYNPENANNQDVLLEMDSETTGVGIGAAQGKAATEFA